MALTQKEHTRLKGALTRAINSGDPLKVIATCRDALEIWQGYYWPDDWHRWSIAYRDARLKLDEQMWDLR